MILSDIFLQGTMIPRLLTRKHRRVSVEVHRIAIATADPKKKSSASQKDAQEVTEYFEECIVRCVALHSLCVSLPLLLTPCIVRVFLES